MVDAIHGDARGKVLVVVSNSQPNVRKSFSNLPNAKLVTAQSVNVYDVLNASTLVLTEGSVDSLQTALKA